MRTSRRVLALSAIGAAVAVSAVIATAGTAAAGPAVSADPGRVDSEREAVARAYIDALLSHDASDVAFAPGATRVEAGLKTGFTGAQMAWDLTHGPQYRVIQGIRDLELSEQGDVVSTRYLLDAGIAGATLMTVEIVETFEIPDGTIHAVVAHITPKFGA
ncbi:hypothetical protein ACFWPA_07225 [Rhodococcus sp. NPDC058505]|uniref:hypothetical protein n=1 Tax=unclassified Rhodococcus (in: high G+C Gram-positive bacteria) TaxID=192944 RepID=UPI00366469F8